MRDKIVDGIIVAAFVVGVFIIGLGVGAHARPDCPPADEHKCCDHVEGL